MSVFVMVAIFFAGVSPACAFMFGKDSFLLEICKPDGSVQTVEVSDEFDPFAETDDVPLSEHLEVMEQCAFCFAAAHQVQAFEADPVLIAPSLPRYLFVSSGTIIPNGVALTLYHPRGPPQLS